MDQSGFSTIISRWRRVLLAGTLLAAVVGWGVTQVVQPQYESRAVVLVGSALTSPVVDAEQLEVSRRLTETYAELAVSRPLLQRVAGTVGIADEPEVTVTPERDPPVLRITAVWSDAETAAAIANAVVTELVILSPSHGDREEASRQFISRQLNALEEDIDATASRIDELLSVRARTLFQEQQLVDEQARLANLQSTYANLLSTSSERGSNLLSVVEDAIPSRSPASPNPVLNTLVAGLVGFFVALAVILLRERVHERLRSPDDVEAALRLPLVGAVPRLAIGGSRGSALAMLSVTPDHRAAEGFAALVANIQLLTGDSLRSLLVTSSLPGEGKTTVAANLAIVFARAGKNTVLVDADVQHPSLHRHFGAYHSSGLSDYLRNPGLDASDLLRSTDVDGLRLVTAGSVATTRLELVGSPRLDEFIHALTETADLVILDGPSVIGVAETASLATYVDTSLLVVNAERTRRPTLEAARDALMGAGATLMGSILNSVRVAGASPSLLARMRRPAPVEHPTAEEGASRS